MTRHASGCEIAPGQNGDPVTWLPKALNARWFAFRPASAQPRPAHPTQLQSVPRDLDAEIILYWPQDLKEEGADR